MLTDAKLRALKPADSLYRVADAKGLTIEIPTAGALRWRLRYRFAGKAKMLSLGILGWCMANGSMPLGEYDEVDPELAQIDYLPSPNPPLQLGPSVVCHPPGSLYGPPLLKASKPAAAGAGDRSALAASLASRGSAWT
jgi:hypothetical protein